MRSRFWWFLGGIFASFVVFAAGCGLREKGVGEVSEINVDLGRNIVDTAQASGVSRFQAQEVAGFVMYSADGIPEDIAVRYNRPGYEIVWKPVFGLTLYADRDRFANLKTQKFSMSLNVRGMTDERAQAFTEATIAQFQKGKWQRYADPDWEVMLTGRSSILDENGKIAGDLRTVDPGYKLTPDEWREAALQGLFYIWVGDGVHAQLTVRNMPGERGKPYYYIDLEFELLDVRLKRFAEQLAKDLKDGDAKGWNSTADHQASKLKAQARNKRLIENAIRRGDALYVPPAP